MAHLSPLALQFFSSQRVRLALGTRRRLTALVKRGTEPVRLERVLTQGDRLLGKRSIDAAKHGGIAPVRRRAEFGHRFKIGQRHAGNCWLRTYLSGSMLLEPL
jgi:hypothetical protein